MTPKDLLNEYRNLQVRLASGRHLRIDIHQYRNAKGLWDENPAGGDHKCVEGFYTAKPALEGAIRKYAMHLGGSGYQLLKGKTEFINIKQQMKEGTFNPFDGNPINYDIGELLHVFDAKGSPAQIGRALEFAADLGVVAKLLNRKDPVTRSDVQEFADKYIGLDCNGFVGNYARAIGLKDPGPSTSVGAFAAKTRRRKSLEEVRALDALIWMESDTRGKHVAIIDSILSEQRENGQIIALDCLVCESAGSSRDTSTAELAANTDGLCDTLYTITYSGDKHFKPFNVKRGLGWHHNPRVYKSKSSGHVAIASLS